MNNTIGIRHEDKYKMERRVAIPPEHVRRLIKEKNLRVLVEKSSKRIFTDEEYHKAGAELVDDLTEAPVIFGVKEIPFSYFEHKKTYVFFSHVIKGQDYNMPMLKTMMDKKCNLIDYETVVEESGKRIIFFGHYAGLAGMINSLWAFGQRLNVMGIHTPFAKLKQAHNYVSLFEAKDAISEVGFEIAKNGLPDKVKPMVVGFTGYGNVSRGAQEIMSLLPVKEISPEELLNLDKRGELSSNVVYKVVFRERDLVTPINSNQNFELKDYYNHPQNYKSVFEQYIPHLTILMNCMYWDDRYPKIVTKAYLEELYSRGEPKLKVIGDVTCDPEGSVECTHKGTEIEDPVFVYNPFTREPKMGFEGQGILDMAVDILPSELPRESSLAFGDALEQFIYGIATADYEADFENIDLPLPIRRAMILHKGELTPDYQYLKEYLK
ncbi:MAG: hypothetical protein K9J27_10680 [Bacteroidales bacterium]|nr:hypothetical protein [Bacteroidales bacterium]MCF8334305.1 hypothetical protein [Bacteroidales bacterium]